ncbi:menaquinol-cytochrome c reductase iron-sulfur subunit precursor [Kribbella pratensis]|uniref:Cytochrome bc1 complex Rieske iron-sulfur subunit n=1 Tax=Kribbella pratensis TaxID=2512112 RepID=A0ABY2FM12_9ACTN|nr:menaquinol-cytochrome c reductase iron-sulfur subunit precursor [Kribbella pratensis]TDX02766.1 menaquinol-cytochrome c reductase iron-sulfur subunit precursor [Kribbella sp. VKM Ac-2566]
MSDKNLPVKPEDEHGAVEVAEPIPDPGLEPHEPRITDIDPKAADRVERQVSGMFGLATLLVVGSCVAYFAIPRDSILEFGPLSGNANNMVIGLCIGLALFLIGAGAIQWAKKLMVDEEISEERHPAHSSPQQIAEITEAFKEGTVESGFGRRKMIRNSLIGALGVLGLPAVILLRDLGPLPGRALYNTIWAKGIRVVNDVTDRPIKPSDLIVGQLVNAAPANLAPLQEESAVEYQNAKAKAAVIVVRIKPSEIRTKPGRENWGVDGILCYSKICTHVGCPISLYEQTTHHVLCPCHQSTFDLADSAKVVFGPAARPLPQLPLAVDSEGYLVAQSGFTEPVGPSFFERG